jgi:hypothetical protein
MKDVVRYIDCSSVRVNSARMELQSALPQGHFSIDQKYNHSVQAMMNAIMDGSRCRIENGLKRASMDH